MQDPQKIDQFVQQLLDSLWTVDVERPSVEEILSNLATVKRGETLEIYLHFEEDEEPIIVLGNLTYELTRQYPAFMKATGCIRGLIFADGFREPDEFDGQSYRQYLRGKKDALEELRQPIEGYLHI